MTFLSSGESNHRIIDIGEGIVISFIWGKAISKSQANWFYPENLAVFVDELPALPLTLFWYVADF